MAFAAPFGWNHNVGRRTSPFGAPDLTATAAHSALDNLKLAVAVLDVAGDLLLSNPRFDSLFGGEAGAATLRAAVEAAATGMAEITLGDGRALKVETTALPHGLLVTAEDVSDRLAERAQAAAEARLDAATGLGNGLWFREQLAALAALPDIAATPAAVLVLSLDRLKEISEPLGHPLGEAVLKTAAERLRSAIGTSDLLARLDGDKFAILQLGQPQPRWPGSSPTWWAGPICWTATCSPSSRTSASP